MNVNGGTRPRLPWGRSSLYCGIQDSVRSRTWDQMGIEYFLAVSAVEALDEGVLPVMGWRP
jgi:hypothetical protein